jgi:PadR family transcriptional regulator, regulatory protein PadR
MTGQAFFVLAALAGGPRPGYGIVGEVAELSQGRVRPKIGSLYGVLDRLAAGGLIEPDREEAHDGRLRRYYRLTRDGRGAGAGGRAPGRYCPGGAGAGAAGPGRRRGGRTTGDLDLARRPHRHLSAPGIEETKALLRRTQDMPFQPPRRPSSVLASVLAAAGIVLTVASCSHVAPLGPTPQPRHLRSPFVLEALRIQPATKAGGCPAGSVALSGGPGQCYRKLGTPVTFSSAAVYPVSSHQPRTPQGQAAGPAVYAFMMILPGAEVAALTAVTTTAADSQGYLDISVAGKTWLLPKVLQPFTGPQLEIALPTRNQTRQLQHILVPPS